MSFRDAEIIRSDALARIDADLDGIRTETGEPIVDLIDAFAQEAQRQQTLAEYNRRINSIAGWQSLINDDSFKALMADAFGVSATKLTIASLLGVPTDLPNDVEAIIYHDLNFYGESIGIPRREATQSTGTITLFLNSGAPFTLVAGATVQTRGITPVLFETTVDLTAVAPSFNAAENSFFVSVSIRARVGGIKGNQILGAVSSQSPAISGVTRVRNDSATQNGVERQTNADYLTVLEGGLAGYAISTRTGLKNFVLEQTDVIDALVVGPESELMTRSSAGAVDVYLIGERLETTVLKTVLAADGEEFVLPLQPVRQINSAVGSSPYVEGGGFTFVKDSGAFADSAQGSDKIVWDIPPTGPTATETVEVNFTFNALMRDLQLRFDSDPSVEVPGTSILIKEGTLMGVEIQTSVVPTPGTTQAAAETAVTAAFQEYLSGLKLGELVEFSTIVAQGQLAEVDGEPAVDRLDGTVIRFVAGVYGTSNLSMVANEYGRLENVTYISPA